MKLSVHQLLFGSSQALVLLHVGKHCIYRELIADWISVQDCLCAGTRSLTCSAVLVKSRCGMVRFFVEGLDAVHMSQQST